MSAGRLLLFIILHKYVQAENCFILNVYKYINTLCLSFCIKKAHRVKFGQNYVTKRLQWINDINYV